ncbi:hypothetical protein GWI33_020920 [Rhynchophorus ferrugineus]|uniref:Uncharacterized protein n=1 Tax=Rhynchophorus ferrugineus TaxID=354439 RepID=A0A834HNX6_RHYFE|nr:hypothetical protein GWI33_020920 [Rhynchophorus ferrugineus]
MPIARAEVKPKASSVNTSSITTLNKSLPTGKTNPTPVPVPKTPASNKSVSKSPQIKSKETQSKPATFQNQAKEIQKKPQVKQVHQPTKPKGTQPAISNKTKPKELPSRPAANKTIVKGTKPVAPQPKVEQKKTTKPKVNQKKIGSVTKSTLKNKGITTTSKNSNVVGCLTPKDIAEARAQDKKYDAIYRAFGKDAEENDCLIKLSPSELQELEQFKIGESDNCDIRNLPLSEKHFDMIKPFITEYDPKKAQKILPPRPKTPLRTKTPPPNIPVTKNLFKIIPNNDPIHAEDQLAKSCKDLQYKIDNGAYVDIFDPK